MNEKQRIDAVLRLKAQMYKEIDLILKKTEQKLLELQQQDDDDRPERRYY